MGAPPPEGSGRSARGVSGGLPSPAGRWAPGPPRRLSSERLAFLASPAQLLGSRAGHMQLPFDWLARSHLPAPSRPQTGQERGGGWRGICAPSRQGAFLMLLNPLQAQDCLHLRCESQLVVTARPFSEEGGLRQSKCTWHVDICRLPRGVSCLVWMHAHHLGIFSHELRCGAPAGSGQGGRESPT